jgi:hypothetical protein
MKKYIMVIIALFYCFIGVNMVFATGDTWTQKTSFGYITRFYAVGFSIGSKGYIGTGDNYTGILHKDFWEYDPADDTWTQKADFGGIGRAGAVGFSIGSKGYIGTGHGYDSGSYSLTKDFWEYDPAANSWTKKADFGGTARAYAVGFSIGSKGYIGTGQDDTSSKKQDFWEYDPAVNSWTKKADFGGAVRGWAVGFSIGSKGYIGTGGDYNGSIYQDFWEYDPVLNAWTKKADFGGTARHSAVGFSIGSKGYIGMGIGGGFEKNFWEYDQTGDTWTRNADFSGTQRATAVGFSIGSKGYIGTGYLSDISFNDFWEYEPADRIPDKFKFLTKIAMPLNTLITSNTITVSGINATTPISISGGEYSINGGEYTSEDSTVNDGDTVTVRLLSSNAYSSPRSALLTIGGVNGPFIVLTKAEDATVGSDGGDNDYCFIATAAFGSPLAGQVNILRQFRDKYLLTNATGKKFVSWYYRNGPVAASWIKDKPLAKVAVQAALYPLIGFSLLLISGYLPLVTIGLLLSTLLLIRFRPKKLIAK